MNKPIVTMDFETDPFAHGKHVFPFACGVYGKFGYYHSWSKNCVEHVVKFLDSLEPSVIYMHNGGKFDIYFLMSYLDVEMRIINGRIVTAHLGKHEFRDSMAILPIALGKTGKKKDIDIDKLRRENREANKDEILSYLYQDCVGLHELVVKFIDEFGDYLTIGSAAIAQLRKFHPFENGTYYNDEKFRSNFYFGGRVQCFQSGMLTKPYTIYDVNSMYPFVMKNFRHPTGVDYNLSKSVNSKTAFVVAEGTNYGALPFRNKKGGIDFTGEKGTYYCTIHEWNAALDTNTFKPTRVIKTYDYDEWITFDKFVDHFFQARLSAKLCDDSIHEIFYKLILNSAYGKFAQNPANFADYAFTTGNNVLPNPWIIEWSKKNKNVIDWIIWKKPITRYHYYNVATGASITGAARSVLLRGLQSANDLIYCDTDSIIARSIDAKFSDTELGAWKVEGSGTSIAMAGKKLYACFDKGKCIKRATKGARISANEIVRVANGEMVTYRKDSPTFRLDGSVTWIKREIRKTI